jgi:hypothetical protein
MTQIDSIDVAELRELADCLFRGLEEAGVDRIAVIQNLYWTVVPDQAFNLYEDASPLVGDLAEDLEDLRTEVTNLRAGEHLSGLLKFIASADLDGEGLRHAVGKA